MEKVKIKVLRRFRVKGKAVAVGKTIEVNKFLAAEMVNAQKAIYVSADAKAIDPTK